MSREPYTYAILRYRHDPIAGEQINVGVVLYAARSQFLRAHFRKAYGRIAKVFPDVNGRELRKALSRIERAFEVELKSEPVLFSGSLNVLNFAHRVVGVDDSSLVWSEMGSGVTSDPLKTLESLHRRFIGQYDRTDDHRRQDADVWKPFRERLLERKISDIFERKVIHSPRNDVEFDHAWKNGIWHCIQPLSFDLSTPDGIQEKAARWVGQMVGLSKAEERFKSYFLVGAPSDVRMQNAYVRAIEFLREAPEAEVILEDEMEQFADTISDKVSESRATASQRG